MEVTETLSDGLRREFQVSGFGDRPRGAESRAAGRAQGPRSVAGVSGRERCRSHTSGRSMERPVMAETIEAVIRELNAKIVN